MNDANSLFILSTIQNQNEQLVKIEKNFKILKFLMGFVVLFFAVTLFLTFFSWLNLNKSQILLNNITNNVNGYLTKSDLENYHSELVRNILNINKTDIEKLSKKIVEIETKLSNTTLANTFPNNYIEETTIVLNKQEQKTNEINTKINLKDLVNEYFMISVIDFENMEKRVKNKVINRLTNKLKKVKTKDEFLNISKDYLQKIVNDFKKINLSVENIKRDLTLNETAQTLEFLKRLDLFLK